MDIPAFLQQMAHAFCTDDDRCDGEWIDGLLEPCPPCRRFVYSALFPLGQTLDWACGYR